MQFKASMERIADKDGKTYFAYNSDGGGTFYWKSSDDFKVWDGYHTGRNYKIQLPQGASYTTFTNDPDNGLYAETVALSTLSIQDTSRDGTVSLENILLFSTGIRCLTTGTPTSTMHPSMEQRMLMRQPDFR